MNHIYKVIWNENSQTWSAAPENKSSKKCKSSNKRRQSALFSILLSLTLSNNFANATPQEWNSTTDTNITTSSYSTSLIVNSSAINFKNRVLINGNINQKSLEIYGNSNVNFEQGAEFKGFSSYAIFAKGSTGQSTTLVLNGPTSIQVGAEAIRAETGATITINGDLSTERVMGGGTSWMLNSSTGSKIIINGNFIASNTTTGNDRAEIGVGAGSELTITGHSDITGSLGDRNNTIYAQGAGAIIKIESVKITNKSLNKLNGGVRSQDNASITINGDAEISIQGGSGVIADNSSTLNAKNLTITREISGSDTDSSGIYASNGSTINYEKSKITMDGEGDIGINAKNTTAINTKINSSGLNEIIQTGKKQTAVYASKSTIQLNNGLSISSNGEDSIGLASKDGGIIEIKNGLNLDIQGAHSQTTNGCNGGTAICLIGDESKIHISGQGNISSTGHGILLLNGTDIETSLSQQNIKTTSSADSLIKIDNATGASIITLTDSTATSGKNGDGMLLEVINGSNLDLVTDNTKLYGKIKASSDSIVNMVMKNGSYFKGDIDPIHLNLDASSSWDITATSQLGNLVNSGNVQFLASSSNTAQVLTVDNYSGGGTLGLNTYLNNGIGSSDLLEITSAGAVSGSNTLKVLSKQGLTVLPAGKGLLVVQAPTTATNDSNFALASSKIYSGTYEYSLYRNADGNWYLLGTDTAHDGSGPLDPRQPNYNGSPSIAASLLTMAQLYGSASLGTWRDRRGHPQSQRDYQPETMPLAESPMWVRLHHERGQEKGGATHQSSSDGAKFSTPKLDYNFSFLQLGSDIYHRQGADGARRIAGWSFTTGRVQADVKYFSGAKLDRLAVAGQSKIDNLSLGGYWTHISPSGMYADMVAQYTLHKVHGQAHTDLSKESGRTLAASVELGKTFTPNNAKLLITPQAQLRWQNTHIDRMASTTSNQVDGHYVFGSRNYAELRLGVELRSPSTSDLKQPSFWLRTDLLKDFQSTDTIQYQSTQANGTSPQFASGRKATSLSLRGGGEYAVNPSTTVYGSAGYLQSISGDQRNAWSLNVGLRKNF